MKKSNLKTLKGKVHKQLIEINTQIEENSKVPSRFATINVLALALGSVIPTQRNSLY